ncbi:MAG: alpha-hydroxy acid oxidase [Pikeienuella sp.]
MSFQSIHTADDARRIARRKLPRLVFDYIDGAAGTESGAARNRRALTDVELQPRALRHVVERSLKTKLLSSEWSAPFGVAPMGMCGLSHPKADQLLAEACVERGLPIGLSTAASMSIEDMARHAGSNAWFQLYANPSVDQTNALVGRAEKAGYKTLILTVDVPEVAQRAKDIRNGFKMPFRIGPKQFLDFATHPTWSLSMLANGAPRPENFYTNGNDGFDRHGSRAWADWDYFARLREEWKGELIVKGVTSTEDAKRMQAEGADGIWVSNHGGRQLDSAPAAITTLPHIRTAVGPDFPVLFDSGVRNGEDVVSALAMGANFVMLGRPLLFAMAAGGRQALGNVLDTITSEVSTTMAQIGVSKVEEIDRNCLTSALKRLA